MRKRVSIRVCGGGDSVGVASDCCQSRISLPWSSCDPVQVRLLALT